MRRTVSVLLTVVIMMLTLVGCSALFEREYSNIQPHMEQSEKSEQAPYQTVNNYSELKENLTRLIRQAKEMETIRFSSSYSGSLSRDIPQAIYEVMHEDPVAAYAVEYIPNEPYTHYLNYSEVQISISYRVEKSEIGQIQKCAGLAEYSEMVHDSIKNLESSLVVECSYYDEELYDLNRILERQLLLDPMMTIQMPQIQISFYPDNASSRIVRLDFTYSDDLMYELTKRKTTEKHLEDILDTFQGSDPIDRIEEISRWFLENTSYQTEGSENLSTVYGAVSEKRSDSKGIALTAKLLAQNSGIAALVVSGSRNGEPYYWNLVEINGQWMHWDVPSMLQGSPLMLANEDTMDELYEWPAGSVPTGGDGENVYLMFPESDSEETGDGETVQP